MTRSIFLGLVVLSMLLSMVDSSIAKDGEKQACCKDRPKDTSSSNASSSLTGTTWVCPLFPVYQYGEEEYLYYAERLEDGCFDEPQAAYLIGYWVLPRDCELGECVNASSSSAQVQNNTQENKAPKFRRMDARVQPSKIQEFKEPHLKAEVDFNVPFIKFQFEDSERLVRHVVARVNRVSTTLPNPKDSDETVTRNYYVAWETIGVPEGSQILTVGDGDVQSIDVLDPSRNVVGKMLNATLTHPLTKKRIQIRVILAD